MSTQPKKEILIHDFPQGISLIEANASNRKNLFYRADFYFEALLELKLEVQQILLVTFTVEATQQMKKRIFEVGTYKGSPIFLSNNNF